MVEVGRRVVREDGQAAIYLGPVVEQVRIEGSLVNRQVASKVYKLTSGQQATWRNAEFTEDAASVKPQAVVVLNASPMKISTVFWGVLLAHLAIGVAVGLILIVLSSSKCNKVDCS